MGEAVFPPYYLPGPNYGGGNEDNGDLPQKTPCMHCCTQCLQQALPAHTSAGGVGRQWPAAWLGVLSAAVCAWNILKEVAIIFITSTIVWPQVEQQGGNSPI